MAWWAGRADQAWHRLLPSRVPLGEQDNQRRRHVGIQHDSSSRGFEVGMLLSALQLRRVCAECVQAFFLFRFYVQNSAQDDRRYSSALRSILCRPYSQSTINNAGKIVTTLVAFRKLQAVAMC